MLEGSIRMYIREYRSEWSGKKVGSGGRWEGACGRVHVGGCMWEGWVLGGCFDYVGLSTIAWPTTKRWPGGGGNSSSLPTRLPVLPIQIT